MSCTRDIFITHRVRFFIRLITHTRYVEPFYRHRLTFTWCKRYYILCVEKEGSLQRLFLVLFFVKSVNCLWSERLLRSGRTVGEPSPPSLLPLKGKQVINQIKEEKKTTKNFLS